ncbi:MAG: biotin/lipoyl-containing protein, partial [Phyllobacterium sp.]
MPINITMPALSPTMEEGNLAKWLVKEGDKVGPGDVIAEIETDKATMEVEAVDEGTVAKIVVPAGTEGVKVNALIAILAGEGEDVAAAAEGGKEAAPAKAEAPKEEEKADAAEAPKAQPAKAEAPKQEAKPAAAAAEAPVAAKPGDRPFSSPLARRIAKDAGIDLAAVTGSGPHGRIIRKDVEAAISGGGAKAAA